MAGGGAGGDLVRLQLVAGHRHHADLCAEREEEVSRHARQLHRRSLRSGEPSPPTRICMSCSVALYFMECGIYVVWLFALCSVALRGLTVRSQVAEAPLASSLAAARAGSTPEGVGLHATKSEGMDLWITGLVVGAITVITLVLGVMVMRWRTPWKRGGRETESLIASA